MTQSLPASIELKVITSRRLVVDARVQELSIPSLEGYVGVLPGHRPMVIALGKGDLSFKQEKKEENVPVRGGFAEIFPDKVLVFTEIYGDETDKRFEGKG